MSRGINKVILIELYQSGLSIPQVADRTGKSRSTVRRQLKLAGVLRSRKEGVQMAAEEGRIGSGLRGKKRVFSRQHKENIRKARLSHAEKFASGVSLKPNGYVEVTRGSNKGKGLHRVIAEEAIGRKLKDGEVVHHIDGDRSNNDPSNLEVMTHREHCRHHANENHRNRQRDALGRFR